MSMDLDEFRDAWRGFARRWDVLRATDEPAARSLVGEVLATGLLPTDAEPGEGPDDDVLLACERAVIEASGEFDADAYRRAHPDLGKVKAGELTPLEQFCENGWTWLRNPRPDFDVDWYWHEYLDPLALDVNPFLHFLLIGRRSGNQPKGTRRPVRPDAPRAGASTRRVCLFAAYDPDGVVDEYVLDYLTELSRHADVYYLCDGQMADSELARLSAVTKGVWAVQHGRYDFGSYSMLANELVGWDVLDTYDELLFANDSCFLLRPLDEVFEQMAEVPADWWGLQPTKRPFRRENGDTAPIPMAEALQHHAAAEDWFMFDRLHISSYFLLFRKRVMDDAGFRERLAAVRRQHHKSLVIVKYEIGLSNYLLDQGFGPAAFIDELFPFHPMYSVDFFGLLGRGFPIIKRNFIGENTQRVPDMQRWKERILEHAPGARVDVFERNILRVVPDDSLQSSFRVRTLADGTVDDPRVRGPRAFRNADRATPTFEHWWAFPVCAYDHTFADSGRAVFEEVRDDPSIKKIVLTRSRRIEVEGENVVVVPLKSPEGQDHLLRSGQVLVKHGPTINLHREVDPTTHNVVNLWHGIPLKRFGMASARIDDRSRANMLRNHGGSRAIISSSHMDRLAMTAAFFPASYPDIWPTGLPRNDFILRDEDRLPADLRATLDRLRGELAGRRLVMFLPTFRDGQGEGQYRFDRRELEWLTRWAERHGAVIGVREHMADKARTYSSALLPLGAIDLSSRRYPDLEILYRAADALISDYSSCLVDFLLTGKPVMSFAYDYERYDNDERGLFHQLERVLPGPVCRTFDELAAALDVAFDRPTAEQAEEYDWKRRIFFDHVDDQSSWRVVQRIKGLYLD